MTQTTTQITAKRFFRQDTKPNSAPDGATWVTESDGSGNDTVSRYQYDATADTWELNSAVGPSEPNAGTNVPGATWRDTTTGSPKQYDGTTFANLGATKHTDLEGIKYGTHTPGNGAFFAPYSEYDTTYEYDMSNMEGLHTFILFDIITQVSNNMNITLKKNDGSVIEMFNQSESAPTDFRVDLSNYQSMKFENYDGITTDGFQIYMFESEPNNL